MALSPYFEVFDEIERSLERCGRAALCQIVRTEGSTPGKAGWKLLVCPDGSTAGNLGGGAFEAMVQTEAATRLLESEPRSEVKRYYFTEEAVKGEATGMVCGGMAEVFFEVLVAKPVLVICGGGPVGQALARNAALCDFEVLVADDRETYRQPGLFPSGTHIAEVDRDYSQDFLASHGEREIFVAVVTRCWQTDLAASSAVLRQRVGQLRYLGILGSRRQVERIPRELTEQGIDLGGVPVYAPIGLAIGGDSPAEIAVSILAEIIQVRSGKRTESATAKAVPEAVGSR
jgi:xanthine dehydrogenase accessory factor